MKKGLPTTTLLLLLLCMSLVLMPGCFQNFLSLSYQASGRVTDQDGQGIADVAVHFDGKAGAASDEDGYWAKSDLTGDVEVKAVKQGWAFAPVKQTVSGTNYTDIDFVGYDATTTFEPSGYVRIGYGAGKGVEGVEGVTISFLNPNTGEPATVTTDANGYWSIEEVVGVVDITLGKTGWEFIPNEYTLTAADHNPDFLGTDRVYTGAQVISMAGNLGTTFDEDYPETVSVGGDEISLASSFYLLAKWLMLAEENGITNPETGGTGDLPACVPYLEIEIPDAVTRGKEDGVVVWSDIYTAARDMATVLEETLKIPDEITVWWREFNDLWTVIRKTDSIEEIMGIDMLISLFARQIPWVNNNGQMANYGSVRGGNLPAGWPD